MCCEEVLGCPKDVGDSVGDHWDSFLTHLELQLCQCFPCYTFTPRCAASNRTFMFGNLSLISASSAVRKSPHRERIEVISQAADQSFGTWKPNRNEPFCGVEAAWWRLGLGWHGYLRLCLQRSRTRRQHVGCICQRLAFRQHYIMAQ